MSELIYQRDSKNQIYISTSVYRAMWIFAKARDTTPDEQADLILRHWIEIEHPELFEHQQQIQKMEKELIENL